MKESIRYLIGGMLIACSIFLAYFYTFYFVENRQEITARAIAENNPSLCERVHQTDVCDGAPCARKDLCYVAVAIGTKNIEICNDIANPGGEAYESWRCYVRVSDSPLTDYKECNTINVAYGRGYCYATFAIKVRDSSMCNNAPDTPSREKCFSDYALLREREDFPQF